MGNGLSYSDPISEEKDENPSLFSSHPRRHFSCSPSPLSLHLHSLFFFFFCHFPARKKKITMVEEPPYTSFCVFIFFFIDLYVWVFCWRNCFVHRWIFDDADKGKELESFTYSRWDCSKLLFFFYLFEILKGCLMRENDERLCSWWVCFHDFCLFLPNFSSFSRFAISVYIFSQILMIFQIQILFPNIFDLGNYSIRFE